ncbi:MAG: hypothetical protein H7333_07840, partial [Bdellovibrionales bacterium]|nr:hypothetical protein [Oligoflexia bacterium]
MKSLFKAVSIICFVSILTLNPAQASSSTLSNAIAAAMFAQSGETPLSAEKAKLVIQALQAELAKDYL